MQTIHFAMWLWIALHKYTDLRSEIVVNFQKKLPWVLLPDAIAQLLENPCPSHFNLAILKAPSREFDMCFPEHQPWMCFPDEQKLKHLKVEDLEFYFKNEVDWVSDPEKWYRFFLHETVIEIDLFEQKNRNHQFYEELRTHLILERKWYKLIQTREIEHFYADVGEYYINSQRTDIDEEEYLRIKSELQRLGSLVLARIGYERTGILMNNDWMEEFVYPALCGAYSNELAEKTFATMRLSDKTEERITNLQFQFTEEDKKGVRIKGIEEKLYNFFTNLF